MWWGYPDKLFLKAGGDPAAPAGLAPPRGLVDYVLDGLPSATDQAWAQDVRRSRRRVPCPRCCGTGLGWEVRIRQIEGVSLLAIRQRFHLADLERWLSELKCRSAEGRAAVQELRERFARVRGLGLEQSAVRSSRQRGRAWRAPGGTGRCLRRAARSRWCGGNPWPR